MLFDLQDKEKTVEKTRICASFMLIGEDFDPNYVTQALKTQPKFIQKRDSFLKTGKACGYTAWGLETKLEESRDAEAQLNKVIAPYFDKVELLNRLREECGAEWHVQIVVYTGTDGSPSLGFSKEQLKFLGAIEAEFVDIDFY